MPYRRCGRSGLKLPAISLGLWHNFGGVDADQNRATCSAAPSISASPTSTWPTTTGRRPARRRRPSAGSWPSDLRPYRDELDHLDQGRLRHVARPVRRVGLAQVPDRQPRPEPAAHGPRVRRHLLLPPPRPGHAAGGDDGRARPRGAPGQGALRRHLVLLRRAHAARPSASCAPLGTPLPDPPARLLDAQPLDRAEAARRAAARRAWAASSSRRWRRGCSPIAISTASREDSRAAKRTSISRRLHQRGEHGRA